MLRREGEQDRGDLADLSRDLRYELAHSYDARGSGHAGPVAPVGCGAHQPLLAV